jgi:sigma-B regulation protein RsbU (phosphoserine phosphatase)
MHIVIVDDNSVNLLVMEKILKSAGYHSFTSMSSAQELFDYVQLDRLAPEEVSPIDLILMDIMMPVTDGIEACRRIQKLERLKDVPVIMITALGDSMKLAEALEAGATDYVMKPINKIELIARIKVALKLKYEKDWHKENDNRIRHELELAKQVQSSLLSPAIKNERISIQAEYQPSSELAGDFYTWYRIDEHRYGIILLDIMGHGISSSLVCMFMASVLKDTITRYVSPEIVIAELNRYMNQLNGHNQMIPFYFTCIYILIDLQEQTIEYVNAGHPPGYIIQEDQTIAELDQGCCAVGFFEQLNIQKSTISFTPSIRILLYTDGLLNAFEESASELDVNKKLRSELEKRAELESIVEHLIAPTAEASYSDDICIVHVQIHE